jgi:hypothetical protein
MKGPKDYYKPGSWNACCDRCGKKAKADELKKEWQGFMVCATCFEERHPQDLIRVPQEHLAIPWSRPRASYDEKVYVTFGPVDPSDL